MNEQLFELDTKEIKEMMGFFVVYLHDDVQIFADDYKIVKKLPYKELYLYHNGKLIAKTHLENVAMVDAI